MSHDRFIYFSERVPSETQVENVLVNFVGDASAVEKKEHPSQSWWIVSIPGHLSMPLAAERPEMDHCKEDDRGRWIEVFFDPDGPSVDVLTRMMDEYTNAIANGIAAVFKRYWKGRLDE